MTYDLYLLRARLDKMLIADYARNPENYSTEYTDGANLVLDCLRDITGVKFHHVSEDFKIM